MGVRYGLSLVLCLRHRGQREFLAAFQPGSGRLQVVHLSRGRVTDDVAVRSGGGAEVGGAAKCKTMTANASSARRKRPRAQLPAKEAVSAPAPGLRAGGAKQPRAARAI